MNFSNTGLIASIVVSGKSCTVIGGPVGLGIGFMARVGIGLDTGILIIFVGDGLYDNIITHTTDLWMIPVMIKEIGETSYGSKNK